MESQTKFEEELGEYLNLKSISTYDVTMDGDLLAYAVKNTFKDRKDSGFDLKIVDLSRNEVIRNDHFPKCTATRLSFNEEGKKLALLYNSGKKSYIYTYFANSNIPEKTMFGDLISDLRWHGSDMIISMQDPMDETEKAKFEDGYDEARIEENPRFYSIWKYSPGNGLSRISSGVQIWEFDARKDLVAAVVSDTPDENSWYSNRMEIYDMREGTRRTIFHDSEIQVSGPKFDAECKDLAFISGIWSDRGVTSGDLVIYDLNSGKLNTFTESKDRSFSSVSRLGSDFYVVARKEDLSQIFKIENGTLRMVWERAGSLLPGYCPVVCPSHKGIFATFSSWENPYDIYVLGREKDPIRVTSENAGTKRKTFNGKGRKINWKSSDGTQIYGYLMQNNPKDPLIVEVHGGPTACYFQQFASYSSVFLSAGFSVFAPNYRGSTGRGREYAELNHGDMGGSDFQDIMDGIRYLKDNGIIETDAIYITGGSYGGFMAAWAMTQSNIFKAGSALFGIADWISFHGTSNIPSWDAKYYQEEPYAYNRYLKFSPLRYVDQVSAPVLLIHGRDDPEVPIGQFLQFYRALKDRGKKVRMISFPREGHGILERKHKETEVRETVGHFTSKS